MNEKQVLTLNEFLNPPAPEGIFKRIGRFQLSSTVLSKLPAPALQRVFEGMVVLHTEGNFGTAKIVYMAYHPSFREIQEGEIVPEYEAFIERIPGAFEDTFKVFFKEDGVSVEDRVRAKANALKEDDDPSF